MVFMNALPDNLADGQNPLKMAALQAAQKELDTCMRQAVRDVARAFSLFVLSLDVVHAHPHLT